MYRAHIQHGTQQPVVVAHTAWRDDEEQVRRDVERITSGSNSTRLDSRWEFMRFSRPDIADGIVSIEQREDAG